MASKHPLGNQSLSDVHNPGKGQNASTVKLGRGSGAKHKALEARVKGKLTDIGKRHIQSYGEQHPDFHSKEMKHYRKTGK